MPETGVKRFERWTSAQEAAESGLLKDDAVADWHVRQKPADPSQYQSEAGAKRHRPEPVKPIAKLKCIRGIADDRIGHRGEVYGR